MGFVSRFTSYDPKADDSPEDFESCSERAREGAGDLGDAHAAAVGDGDLGDGEAFAESLDLHLAGPSEVRIAHAQAPAGIPADGAERAQVRVAVTVEEADEDTGEKIAEAGLRQKRAPLAPPKSPGADGQVGSAIDRREQLRHLLRMIRVVSVQENDDVGRRRFERGESRQAGAAV